MPKNWRNRERTFVRQFARAIIADQLVGDEIARAALRDVDLDALEKIAMQQRRGALFRAFFENWRAARARGPGAGFSDDSLLASEPIPENKARQLLLLVDVMGLPPTEAAELVDMEPNEALALLETEREGLRTRSSGAVLVVEDDPVIAMHVASLLEGMGLAVIGTARTKDEAVAVAMRERPDVMVADYDLGAGGTGLDAVKEITASLPTVSIFLTAYPDDVLAGADFEPAFVLTKPFRKQALLAAVAHALDTPPRQVVGLQDE